MQGHTPYPSAPCKFMANTKKVSSSDLLKIIHLAYEGDPEGLASDLACYVAGEHSLLFWAEEVLDMAEEEIAA